MLSHTRFRNFSIRQQPSSKSFRRLGRRRLFATDWPKITFTKICHRYENYRKNWRGPYDGLDRRSRFSVLRRALNGATECVAPIWHLGFYGLRFQLSWRDPDQYLRSQCLRSIVRTGPDRDADDVGEGASPPRLQSSVGGHVRRPRSPLLHIGHVFIQAKEGQRRCLH